MTPGARSLVVAIVGLAGSAAAQAQQPATLTLACKGTVYDASTNENPQPSSMGIIVDFTTRTVHGFGEYMYPVVKITDVDDVAVAFAGSRSFPDLQLQYSLKGSINRVTGDLQATSYIWSTKSIAATLVQFALQCTPTQRIF
jgi:hypothetical protein